MLNFLSQNSSTEIRLTDIRFYIGASIGVICASLVINRRLYHIANVSAVSITRADKRRNMITDLLIGLGIPLLSIAVCK